MSKQPTIFPPYIMPSGTYERIKINCDTHLLSLVCTDNLHDPINNFKKLHILALDVDDDDHDDEDEADLSKRWKQPSSFSPKLSLYPTVLDVRAELMLSSSESGKGF